MELTPRHLHDLPSLEQLHVFGCPKLARLEAGLLRDLPRLQLVNVTDCGLHWIHPRAFINLPELKELSLPGNSIQDATMVGRAVVDLPSLSVLHLDRNRIVRLAEGSFVDLPMLSRLSLSFNRITEIFPGAIIYMLKDPSNTVSMLYASLWCLYTFSYLLTFLNSEFYTCRDK
jgi:Leucine-rich repeat (LRR) protein